MIVMKFVQTGENLTDMTVIVKQEEFGTVMENAESKKIPVKIRSNSCGTWKTIENFFARFRIIFSFLKCSRILKRLKTTSKGHFAKASLRKQGHIQPPSMCHFAIKRPLCHKGYFVKKRSLREKNRKIDFRIKFENFSVQVIRFSLFLQSDAFF